MRAAADFQLLLAPVCC